MLKLVKYFNKVQFLELGICFVLIVVQVWLDLKLPDYMSEVTRLTQTAGTQVVEIFSPGGYMLLCAFGSLISAIITGYFATRIASTFSFNLRDGLYKKIMTFSKDEISLFSTSSLITRTTNDITQIRLVIAIGAQIIMKAPILAIWAIIKILNKELSWTIATAIAVACLITFVVTLLLLMIPKIKKIQQMIDGLNRIVRESLQGIRVIRAFNAQIYENDKFEIANEDLTQTNLFVARVSGLLSPFMTAMMSGLTLSIYVIGTFLVSNAMGADKLLIFSDMVVFTSYAMQIVMAFMMLTMIFILIPRASVSATRILEVLNTKSKIVDGNFEKTDTHHVTVEQTNDNNEKIESIDTTKGEIEFKNVAFKYTDGAESVLENINFKIESGQTVAIVGSTASGKSTLVNLIPRFFDVIEGEILVDNVNVKDYSQHDLRAKISYVSQKSVLFKGSIISNVEYAEKTPYSLDYKKAIEIAQAEEFVLKLGYDAKVSQGGTNLSGGQKQRISIARAIAKNSEIFIFDDSFSALDYKTDKALRRSMKENLEATIIIVAQRISTIIDADQIIVLDDGTVVGTGTHAQLMSNCEVYKEIVDSQLTKEEQENEK